MVEHDPNDMGMIQHELKRGKLNYIVEVVETGETFESALNSFGPDIILSDFTLPSFNGPAAFKIKERVAPLTPFIFVSGTIGEENSIELIKNGATDFALKERLFTLPIKVNRALTEAREKRAKAASGQALIQNEGRLARAQQLSHLGSWEMDLVNNTVHWSDEQFNLLGFKKDEVIPSSELFFSMLHADDSERVLKNFKSTIDALRNSSAEFRLVRTDGAVIHVYCEWQFEFDKDQNPVGIYGIVQDITEKKNSELKIQESENRFRALIENSSDMLSISDASGNLQYISPNISRFLGYSSENFGHAKGIEIIHPDEIDEYRKGFAAIRQNPGKSHPFIIRMKHANGSWVWMEGTATNLLHVPAVNGVITNFRDITERKKAEESLEAGRHEMETLLNNTEESFILVDRDLNMISFNKLANTRSLELIPQPLRKGMSIFELADPQKIPELKLMYQKVLLGESAQTVLRTKLGGDTELVFSNKIKPVYNNGHVTGVFVISADVTERERVNEKLLENFHELEAATETQSSILDALPANIALLNKDGIIIEVNECWKTFGAENGLCSKNHCIGDNYLLISENATGMDAGAGHKMCEGIKQVIAGKLLNFELEYPCHSQSEERWFRAEVAPLMKKGRSGAVVMHINITEQKQSEITINELNENLEHRVNERTADLTKANNALEAFSSAVSHDLRAPARAVISFAQIIREDHGAGMSASLKELFGFVEENGKRMGAIINDLLKLARYGNEKLKPELVDMQRLVEGVWANIKRTTTHHAILELDELPVLQVDMSLMQQVIVNLLSNAIKYSSKKEHPVIKVWSSQTKDSVTVYFKDNGAGFDMKNYDRLFGAFQRLHHARDFEGTGIGLALVKKIIENHNGTVGAEGVTDEEATFWFTLPISC
ncbi:MAG: domain S-box protein [Bacteroidota bacterium]|nr:domain S-box protein [Bacteroidota bacterium]